jgi:hypothetical protein
MFAKSKNYVIRSAYIGNNQANVGGYSFVEPDERISGAADFVDNDEVLKIAEHGGLKRVHLAGDWSNRNRKGYGESVHIPTARKILRGKL